MATLSSTISIVFGAVDNTGQAISGVSRNISSLNDGISSIAGPLAGFGNTLVQAEAAILTLGAAFAAFATNAAEKFNGAIEETGSLINATPEQVGKLKESVQDFASTSTSNFEQVQEALYNTTSNVGDTGIALDLLAVAEKGAVVGATNLNVAASVIAGTMNAYGLAAGNSAEITANAERVMGALFVTVQQGKTTLPELSSSLGTVASSAAAANVPIEAVGSALAAITGAGINTAQATTILSALLKELISPSEKLTEALGGVSITTDGLQKVMQALKENTGGTAEAIFGLFGSAEAAKGALILANDSAGKFAGSLAAMGTAVDSLNNNFEALKGGLTDTSQFLENNFAILLQKVGDKLLVDWNGVISGINELTKGLVFTVDEGSFDPLINLFNNVQQELGEELTRIAELLPAAFENVDFSKLTGSLEGLSKDVKNLFSSFDLTTQSGVTQAIQFLVDSFNSLTIVVRGIAQAWEPTIRKVIELAKEFNNTSEESKILEGKALGIAQIFDKLTGVINFVTGAMDKLGIALAIIAGSNVITTLTAIAGVLGGTALASAAGIIGGIAVVFGTLTFAIKENSDAWKEYNENQRLLEDTQKELIGTQNILANKLIEASVATGKNITSLSEFENFLTELNERLGTNITGLQEFEQAMASQVITFDEASGKWEKGTGSLTKFDEEVIKASGELFDWEQTVNEVANSLGLLEDPLGKIVGQFTDLAAAENLADTLFLQGKGSVVDYKDGLFLVHETQLKVYDSTKKLNKAVEDTTESNKRGSEEWKRVQDAMLEAQKQADITRIELEKIAAQKYQIDIDANVKIDTAKIAADVEKIRAAFQASDNTIANLNDTVGSLFSQIGKTDSFDLIGNPIKSAARRAEKRLDEELDLKTKLTDQVLEQSRALADRLRSGEPLIQIDGGTLAPELELIFQKILQFTQIRSTNQGLNLLLGIL